MTPDDLANKLLAAGLSSRVHGEEVQVETCVFCGNPKWNLELNPEKGVYHCWACRTGGRVEQFLLDVTGQVYRVPVQRREGKQVAPPPIPVGEFASIPVGESPVALHYLARRGIDMETARRFGLRVCTDEAHRLAGRIVLPARDYWTGDIIGWVGRSFTGKLPKYLSVMQAGAITGWRAQSWRVPAVVVEGHFDGIAVHSAGYSAAVLAGTGQSAALDAWAARLPAETPIVVLLDGDAADRADALYWRISTVHARVASILLEVGEDPASVGTDRIEELVKTASVY